jgi:hypothetical protein
VRFVAALLILLSAGASACSPAPTPVPTPRPHAGPPPYTSLHLDVLSGYQAAFQIRFEGNITWAYDLEIRSDGSAVEYRLHLDGLSPLQNPGDVRLVMQAGHSQMRGPGTDDECVLFPSDLPQGPRFLGPDELAAPGSLSDLLEPVGIEPVAGQDTIHYTVRAATLGEWREVQVDLWRDESNGAVLRHEMLAAGRDPYFAAGEGSLTSQFLVGQVGPQAIEPVAGCEIDLPLPADSTRLVKLPGLITFDSASTPEQLSAFYQAQLPASQWVPAVAPEASGGVFVLSYLRAAETLEINIEPLPAGARVELLLGSQ